MLERGQLSDINLVGPAVSRHIFSCQYLPVSEGEKNKTFSSGSSFVNINCCTKFKEEPEPESAFQDATPNIRRLN